MASGSDVIMDRDGVKKISTISHNYIAPDAVGSIYQKVTRNLQFEPKTQAMVEHHPKSKMQTMDEYQPDRF